MFIDIHVHARLFDYPERNVPGGGRYATPEEIIGKLGPRGVRKAVVFARVNPDVGWFVQPVEEILEMARQYPDFIIPFMNVDPRMVMNAPEADLGYLMDHYLERGCRGIGEVCCNLTWDDPRVENLLAHAGERGLPLTFHIAPKLYGYYGLADEMGLPGLEGALRKFPGVKFLGHSQPFWAEISGDLTAEARNTYPRGPVAEGGAVVRLMREYPNLLGDLSAGSGFNAISRDPDFGFAFMEEFQDRLFFGTDFADVRNETPIIDYLNNAVATGSISREVYEKIGWRNAEKLLGV
ncbi:MAG: amidohydrolase family protein [Armatimonadetes bacterium]|nr:amidohydrolase family protein [Armatimonadota bacterium]